MSWDQLAPEIAQALGQRPEDVPRPGTQEFHQMLGLLLEAQPQLAARVQAWLVQSTEPVSSQAEIASEARKADARQRLLSLFTRPDHTQPTRRRINKAAILATALAVMGVLWLVGRLHQTPTPLPHATHPPTHVAASAPQQPSSLPPQQPPVPTPARTTPPATGAPAPTSGAAAPLPTPPLPLPLPGIASVPGGSAVVAQQAAADAPQVVVGAADQSQKTSTTVVTSVAASSGQSGAAGGTIVVSRSAQATGPAAPAQGTPPQGASTPPAPHFQVGDQFTVRLLTPIAVSPAWQALPAVAQAEGGPISGWQVVGAASQGQDGSLQIAWTQAMSPDRQTTIAIDGVAYDPKIGKPGVPQAGPTVMAPQAARTTLSGVLGSVSQYVQDQIQAQQTQISGLSATITSQVPPIWQVLAGQLATGFAPAPVQTGGTIMVTRVAAGTPVIVFITKASH